MSEKKELNIEELEKVSGGQRGDEDEIIDWICPDCPSVNPIRAFSSITQICPNCGNPMMRVFKNGGAR